jgi:hypothetical protein
MKKLFLIVLMLAFLLIPVSVSAAPFLVCDPSPGVTGYRLTGPAWVPVSVPAQTDGSLRMDVSVATVGANALTISACIVDVIWGEACSASVPFAFTRPALPPTTKATRLTQ